MPSMLLVKRIVKYALVFIIYYYTGFLYGVKGKAVKFLDFPLLFRGLALQEQI
jgi:hypothetical protein